MPVRNNGRYDEPDDFAGYDVLLDLEDLETLLEQLEEAGVVDEFDPSMLPPDIKRTVGPAGLNLPASTAAIATAPAPSTISRSFE